MQLITAIYYCNFTSIRMYYCSAVKIVILDLVLKRVNQVMHLHTYISCYVKATCVYYHM